MKTLFILNDAPYSGERTYSGLRVANALAQGERNAVRVFLLADSVPSARRVTQTPQAAYNVEEMLGNVIRHGGVVALCGACMDSRKLGDCDIVEGAHRSTLAELSEWTEWADKVLVF